MSKIRMVWESGNYIDLNLVNDYELFENGLCRVYTNYGVMLYGCEEYPVVDVLFLKEGD